MYGLDGDCIEIIAQIDPADFGSHRIRHRKHADRGTAAFRSRTPNVDIRDGFAHISHIQSSIVKSIG
jgi:hypothetical protein